MKETELFEADGWIDIESIMNSGKPFIYITGGRGTGKTYGMIKWLATHQQKFMYIRRTKAQCDIVGTMEFSVFNKYNKDSGDCIGVFTVAKGVKGYRRYSFDADGKAVPYGPVLGYLSSLSTFSNLRGINDEDIKVIVFDEFCPEPSERPIKREGQAFENMYETINRNRELEGEKPLTCVCLANANDLSSPILIQRGLVQINDRLRKTGKVIYEDEYTLYIRLPKSSISEKKSKTVLYQSSKDSRFVGMAIENDFENNYNSLVRRQDLKEYRIICTVGEISIYKHKSRGELYVSTTQSGKAPVFEDSVQDLRRWSASYRYVYKAYMERRVYFEEPLCEILLLKYINCDV